MKVSIISLGCDKATVDSERLIGVVVGHGARLVSDPESADVVLVNTCGFIDAAKQESIETMLQVAALKESAGVRAVVAVGCLVERHKQELQRAMPEIDLLLGFGDLDRLVPQLVSMGLIADPVAAHPGVRRYLGESPHIRYLKISEGCDHSCAFCAIPLMRGAHRSEPFDRLIAEAQQLEREGAKEITLVAQDLGHYGRDLGPESPRLPDLLDALLSETAVPWFRLLYMYPLGLAEPLVEMMGREPRLVPYIDIPIQHASDSVLERMRRPERQDTIRAKLRLLRDTVPDIAIRTTVVLGFPGETDRDFHILKEFIEEVEFERLGSFTYSAQEGTSAARIPDDVPDEIKRERQEELTEIQRIITEDRLGRFVGRETKALVDGETELVDGVYTHVGRVQWQADDVDGVTYLSNANALAPGEFCRILIEDNRDYDFYAKVLS
jgi:ribosomal protein S12 methylthiotransferase